MHRFIYFFAFLALTFATAIGQAQAAQDVISLNLPQSVITKATQAMLPLPIDAHSKTLQGDITIINISELQITDNQITCRLHLAGKNLSFVTDLAGHEIRLKVGEVEVDFLTTALIHFDAEKQTLFIKPMVKDMQKASKEAKADVGQALVALLNGREFPLTMQNLNPIIAKTGTKTVTINTRITDIRAMPGAIGMSLVPAISAK
jgi:hypothetical protein